MDNYEKLGAFYLGRAYDLAEKQGREGELTLYDSKDLVTHAVCVGMTGSGKTGLCIGLLEEAAIDGIPAIVIDPKGDLPNLLLTFPELRPEDFTPWVNEDDARKQELSVEEYGAQQAELWKKGLAGWGQSGERIRRLRESADFAVYTPGSTAGLPVSILSSFAAPPQTLRDERELLGDRVGTTVTSLLGLLGMDADPIKSREHILLSTILDAAWREGRDLDLAALIGAIQSPTVNKVGVLDLETFYPEGERFKLAMALNNLLAAPGFAAWMEGEPLEIDQMLYTAEGKPRVAIFSIAHLGDAERMFFVSLLLNQVLGWMRGQSGTTSLRAIVYMDEIFGYFPPVANPPSKTPLLTLLKQGRAYGVGVVLATQNPVDLDYKGLSNTGTWFIGRLQTERDKARVLEGLEGVAAGGDMRFDRGAMEETLAGLGKRVFLLNNVHEDEPVVFETRWVMSYLRGPLTRDQIKVLMDPRRAQAAARTQAAAEATATAVRAASAAPLSEQPMLGPSIPQHFVPLRGSAAPGHELVYEPMVLAAGRVQFADRKTKVQASEELVTLTPLSTAAVALDWAEATEVDVDLGDLGDEPEGAAHFDELPGAATKKTSYTAWKREFKDWLYRNRTLELYKSQLLKEYSQPGESEHDFRLRLGQKAREARDEALEKLRKKYAPKLATLQERIRRAEQAVAREAEQAKAAKLQTAISVGATLLGAMLGRKAVSRSSVGRATTAARGVGRSMKQAQDVDRARATVEATVKRLADLEAEFEAETEEIREKYDPALEDLETVVVRPKKKDIAVKLVALAWAPHWQRGGEVAAAWE
ncbi:MAG: ATP-binding protein [Gemmatimonadetes bacterium]|nr:ATP-binding protein [Gemmatimonadota bacterium]NIO31037.1 ATP-binding protein [Gemmatimonadota bacterium]